METGRAPPPARVDDRRSLLFEGHGRVEVRLDSGTTAVPPAQRMRWTADIAVPTRTTNDLIRNRVPGSEFDAAATHPAADATGVAQDERMVGGVCRDDRSGTDEGVAADRMSADDRAVGAEGRAASDQRPLKFVLAHDMTAGVDQVGEDHRRAPKHVVFQDHAGVDGDVVLNLDVVADDHIRRDHDVLSDVAPRADRGAGHHVGEVPDLRALADAAPLIDIRRLVGEKAHAFHTAGADNAALGSTIGAWRIWWVNSIEGRAASMPQPRPASTSS